MIGNTVMVFSDNLASVTKERDTLYVFKCDRYAVLIKLVKGEPWVLNTYSASNSDEAYDKWLKWIGKMCKKNTTSKYFTNYKTCPAWTNGYIPQPKERKQILESFIHELNELHLI